MFIKLFYRYKNQYICAEEQIQPDEVEKQGVSQCPIVKFGKD